MAANDRSRFGRFRRICAAAGAVCVSAACLVAQPASSRSANVSAQAGAAPASTGADLKGGESKAALTSGEIPRLEVARAVMVTVELDFGPTVPSIAEALLQIERQYKPDSGTGRTFAILDAYGDPTPTGKLHMSMHISAEKPGVAALVFKRSGEVLWRAQIVPGTNAPAANFAKQGLVILLDNGAGQNVTVDGSKNPKSVLDANAKEMGVPVRDMWPEGSERQLTFLYSACGCPVKVMAMRVGDKTVRTRNLPVIFPDDPAVVTVIKKIMRWE